MQPQTHLYKFLWWFLICTDAKDDYIIGFLKKKKKLSLTCCNLSKCDALKYNKCFTIFLFLIELEEMSVVIGPCAASYHSSAGDILTLTEAVFPLNYLCTWLRYETHSSLRPFRWLLRKLDWSSEHANNRASIHGLTLRQTTTSSILYWTTEAALCNNLQQCGSGSITVTGLRWHGLFALNTLGHNI